MRNGVSPYRLMSENGLDLVKLGPRYGRPLDDTTLLGIEHRTLGAYVGVLLERGEFHALAEWLAADDGGADPATLPPFERPMGEGGAPLYVRRVDVTPSQFRVIDLQTALMITRRPGFRAKFSAWWLGSGRSRGAELNDISVNLFTDWVTDVDTHGWAGWRSGRAEEA
jgi:hypothetical protein